MLSFVETPSHMRTYAFYLPIVSVDIAETPLCSEKTKFILLCDPKYQKSSVH